MMIRFTAERYVDGGGFPVIVKGIAAGVGSIIVVCVVIVIVIVLCFDVKRIVAKMRGAVHEPCERRHDCWWRLQSSL